MDSIDANIAGSFACGRERTAHQNIFFLSDELVEILARALSPGMNDPYTAISCMNCMKAALLAMAKQDEPPSAMVDGDDIFRLIARPVTFEAFLNRICDQSLPYVSLDYNAALHFMKILGDVLIKTDDQKRKRTVSQKANMLEKACAEQLPLSNYINEMRRRCAIINKMAEDKDAAREHVKSTNWIQGSA